LIHDPFRERVGPFDVSDLVHRHEGEEWVTAVSGVAEIRVDGRSFVLREGDSLHFRAHLEHGYVNLSDRPAVLIMVVRPRLAI